jgi:hypothetical protein
MRASSSFLPLVLLAATFAGCSGGEPDDGAAPVPTASASMTAAPENLTATPALPITLEFQDCLQLHTFFPYPIAVFTQLGFALPAGFQYASDNGQTVDVFIAWWSCPSGLLNDTQNAPFGDVGAMFIGMPVVPPTELAGRDPVTDSPQLDLLPLTWVVSNQLAARFLDEVPGLAGGYVDNGDVSVTNELDGPLSVRSMVAHASFGTFDVDATFQASPGENPAGRYRMWLVPDGSTEVAGYLDIANGAGTLLGSGQADLRFQGDPEAGAPPATGGLSHVVDATDVVLRSIDLP